MTSTIEELVDLVLTGQHPSLRERCLFDRIMSVLEDTFGGVYDAAGVRAVLADRRDEVSRCMVKKNSAPAARAFKNHRPSAARLDS